MKKLLYIIILFVVVSAGCSNDISHSEKKYKTSLKEDSFKTYPETLKKVKNKIKENNKNLEKQDKKTQELFNI